MNAAIKLETLVEVVQRAESLATGGDSDAAIDAYQAWLAGNDSPAAYAAHFNLAVLYFQAQQMGLAEAALRACLRCNPGFETAKRLCVEPTLDQRRPMAARCSYGHHALKVVWLGHSSAFQTPLIQSILSMFPESKLEHVAWAWGNDIPLGALDVTDMTDEAVACQMRAIEADILVDLMAWNADSRPGIIAYHPAVTVVSWTAKPQPTGLRTVDAVLADTETPPLHLERSFREEVLRIDNLHASSATDALGLFVELDALFQRLDSMLPARRIPVAPSATELAYLRAPTSRGRRYVIAAPPFHHASAGIRVLYDLQKWLVLAGFDAMVCTWFPGYPIDSFAEDIAIYPEVAPGNLLQAKRVVRFILNTPGKLGYGEKAYAPDELLVAYNSELAPYADGLVLQIPSTEPFFHSEGAVREVDAMYVGKGRNLGLHPAGCIEITKQFPPTRRQVADLLRTVKTLYTYDDFTMLGYEAKLCGCNVTLIDGSGQMKPLHTSYVPTIDEFRAQLHQFIQITQQM